MTLILEVGLKLNKSLLYYDEMLKKHGLNNSFNVETHDIYYTNKNLDGLTENEMKNSCIRLRESHTKNPEKEYFNIQNKIDNFIEFDKVNKNELQAFEEYIKKYGFRKVFDTRKKDHHYTNQNINGVIQLQEIENIGLLVYFDNSKYYNLPLEEQRSKLINELNSYGFSFSHEQLGLDKLRTLYYNKEMYSKNQNG